MEFSKFLNSSIKLNFILIISFSISVNSFTIFPNVNNAFYVLFHLTLIYLIFYHYHYYLYQIIFIYFITLIILLLFEQFLANIIYDYKFNVFLILNFFLISLIIFIPTIFLFNKLDK